MIKFNAGELANILPTVFTREPEVTALSYALKQAYSALWEKYLTVYAWAFVDHAPEYVLDLMAVELRVKYYSADYALDVKRKLIKSAMIINNKDGTKYAVDTVVQNLFGGDGDVQEWFTYGGDNGHFRIMLDAINSYDVDLLLNSIEGVKRKSQHLDGIELKIQHDQSKMYFGTLLLEFVEASIACGSRLEITTQPEDCTVAVGENAIFSIQAVGDALKYQWMFKAAGGTEFEKSGAAGNKTASISVPATATRNGVQYYCEVMDISGKTVNSNIVTLTVTS